MIRNTSRCNGIQDGCIGPGFRVQERPFTPFVATFESEHSAVEGTGPLQGEKISRSIVLMDNCINRHTTLGPSFMLECVLMTQIEMFITLGHW